MIKLKKLRFLVLPFAVLGCVLLLASCKGTGTYYYFGNEKSPVKITSEYWESSDGKRTIIEWIGDNHFRIPDTEYIYYCDGETMYCLQAPSYYYTSKPRKTTTTR